ncbi:MAG: SagB/ThcOx family dehydrogenase [Actinobacteria bacterium]|nr:SagB/ThcOx family dehydrogenase [Actinomycetota bacterium]
MIKSCCFCLSGLEFRTAFISSKLIIFLRAPVAASFHKVADFEPGIYRYLPLEYELLFEFGQGSRQELAEKIGIATLGQFFIGTAAVVFIWAAIPYRTEWRYGIASHKVIAIDAGHVCQNLYLACEAIGAGACAIAAYNQELMDKLIKVDGEDEFVIYLACVGKK